MSLLDKGKTKLESFNIFNAKKTSLAEVLALFINPNDSVRIEAFDGSSVGKTDAPFKIKLNNELGVRYLATSKNELGVLRAYLMDGISVEGIHPGDPYELLRVISHQAEFPKLTPQMIS